MRPRIQVAILGATPLARSVLNVVLDTKGYRPVHPRGDYWFGWDHPWLRVALLVGLEAHQTEAIRKMLAEKGSDAQTVSVRQRGMLPEAIWIARLLDRVRIAAIRRRGAKPAFPRQEGRKA